MEIKNESKCIIRSLAHEEKFIIHFVRCSFFLFAPSTGLHRRDISVYAPAMNYMFFGKEILQDLSFFLAFHLRSPKTNVCCCINRI